MITKTDFFKKRAVLLLSSLVLLACGMDQDVRIKAHINAIATDNLNFAGVKYTVKDGTVTLFGNCPSDKTKRKVLQSVKGINVLKGIRDSITIGPVVLGGEQQIKASVDSVLVHYPLVSAEINENDIALIGAIEHHQAEQLFSQISSFGLPIEKEQLILYQTSIRK